MEPSVSPIVQLHISTLCVPIFPFDSVFFRKRIRSSGLKLGACCRKTPCTCALSSLDHLAGTSWRRLVLLKAANHVVHPRENNMLVTYIHSVMRPELNRTEQLQHPFRQPWPVGRRFGCGTELQEKKDVCIAGSLPTRRSPLLVCCLVVFRSF